MSNFCLLLFLVVVKIEIVLSGESFLLVVIFVYWDNIFGFRVRYIWVLKIE